MDNHVMISVLVAAYNAAEYLARCVDSVLCQKNAAFELVLVDDGSQDATGRICDAYAERDGRVRVIHQSNQGHTGARNQALAASSGAYCLFLDADDWLDDGALGKAQRGLADSSPDILIYGLIGHNLDGSLFCLDGPSPDGVYAGSDLAKLSEHLIMDRDGTYLFPKSLSGKVFRRQIIQPIQDALPRQIRTGEDATAFVLAMLDAKRICVDTSFAYHFTIRTGSVSRRGDPDALKRAVVQLNHLRNETVMRNPSFADQVDRLAVQQLYSAAQRVKRSGTSDKQIRDELAGILAPSVWGSSVTRASLSLKARKLRLKRLILTRGWLVFVR